MIGYPKSTNNHSSKELKEQVYKKTGVDDCSNPKSTNNHSSKELKVFIS